MKKTNSLLARLVTLVLMICLVFSLAIVVSTAAEDPEATISFASTAQRVSQDTSKQVWKNGDLTFTNNKASASSNVVGNVNPVRLYSGSEIIIEALGNITKIVFDANTTGYATTLKDSITSAATVSSDKVTVSSDKVTVVLDGTSESFTVAKLAGQVRLDSITVTYAAAEPEPPAATYNATFYNNGVQHSTEEGVSEATMPSAPVLGGEFSLSYTFAGWAKNEITDETTTKPTLYNAGDKVTLTGDTTFYAVYSYAEISESEGETNIYEKYSGDITEGDYILYYDGNALNAEISSNRFTNGSVTITDNQIVSPNASIVWNISKSDDYWLLYNESTSKYAAGSGTKNQGKLLDSITDYAKWTVSGESTYDFVNLGNKNKGVNYTLRNNGSYGFACYATGTGGALTLYKEIVGGFVETTYYTTTLESSGSSPEACQHVLDEGVITTTPTCTATGVRTYTCTICGEYTVDRTVPATGHSWDDGVQTQDPTCTVAGVKTYTCTGCDETKTEPIPTVPHTFVDKICSECGAEDVDYSGLYYIATIRSSGNYFWMTNDLGTASTKRYQAVDSGLTELPEKIDSAELDKMFYVVKNNDGTYSIYSMGITGADKWLGWTSGNSGTFVNESDKINFTVTEKTDGTYNFCFDGRYLSLNKTTGNNYFAFYEGTQMQNLSLIPVEYDYKYVNLRLGSDLALLYTVYVHSDGTPTMTFTMGDKETVVTEFEKSGKFYTFAFEGIGPHQMGDKINAVLKIGETIIAEINNYSINDNLDNVIANYPEAKALAEAALAYGKAAAAYQSEEPAADLDLSGVTIDENLVRVPSEPTDASLAKFTSAGVYFDVTNKIYVKFIATEGCTVTVNGEEIDLTTLQCVNGTYKYYTDEITAVEFGDEFTFVIKDVHDNEITTLTYSVNAYAAAMQNSTDNFTANLVKALYLYGQAALEYKTLNGGNK